MPIVVGFFTVPDFFTILIQGPSYGSLGCLFTWWGRRFWWYGIRPVNSKYWLITDVYNFSIYKLGTAHVNADILKLYCRNNCEGVEISFEIAGSRKPLESFMERCKCLDKHL